MFGRFKHRSYALERLDTGDYTPEEYARWEREMPWIHGVWGEKRALDNSLIRDIRGRKLDAVSILDVGAGSGTLLRMMTDGLAGLKTFSVGVELHDTAVDSIRRNGSHGVKADALSLPFAENGFDYVMCSLLLHHLSDDDAAVLIAEMDRVARLNFFAVDLNRHPVGYYGYRLLSPLFFQKFTQEDGALSILRSFTPEEMMELARGARVDNAQVRHSRANRLVLSRG